MNIYVGNLSYDVTEAALQAAFKVFGAVPSVSIIKDQSSGQSKGFGFVEMASTPEAQAAITRLNGKALMGRTLNVNEARPRAGGSRPECRAGGFGGGHGGGDACRHPSRVRSRRAESPHNARHDLLGLRHHKQRGSTVCSRLPASTTLELLAAGERGREVVWSACL
jgi:cold-inducible RNA-binding protein